MAGLPWVFYLFHYLRIVTTMPLPVLVPNRLTSSLCAANQALIGSTNSRVKAKLAGKQFICGWFHFLFGYNTVGYHHKVKLTSCLFKYSWTYFDLFLMTYQCFFLSCHTFDISLHSMSKFLAFGNFPFCLVFLKAINYREMWQYLVVANNCTLYIFQMSHHSVGNYWWGIWEWRKIWCG